MFKLIHYFPSRALGIILGVLMGASVTHAAMPGSFVAMRPFLPATPVFARNPVFRVVPPVTPSVMTLPNSATLINPAFQIAPGLTLNQYAFNVRVMAHALRQIPPYLLGYSPYGYGMTGYGYPMSLGYGYGYPMMYGGGYGGGYGRGGYGSNSMQTMIPDLGPTTYTPPPAPSAYDYTQPSSARMETPVTKAGPVASLLKADGGLDWPLALRILPPGPETRDLRDRLDAEVRAVLAADGKVESASLGEMKKNLDRLADIWADRADLMPISEDTRIRGKEFLRDLRRALKAMQ
jgi:hypothetical protein